MRLTLTSKNVEPNRGQRDRVSESKQNSCKLSADHSESSKKETIIAAECGCVYCLCCADCDCDCASSCRMSSENCRLLTMGCFNVITIIVPSNKAVPVNTFC